MDRKDIVISSHRRKSLHHAFWMEQVQYVREIQTTLERNYNGSKVDRYTEKKFHWQGLVTFVFQVSK